MSIPRDPAVDSTLAMMREGYDFIWNRCRRFRSDIFLARVMGKRAVCVHGPEAAALFYDDTKLQRHGAIPRRVVTSLFGKHAVQTLDDDAHRERKAAFMSLMSPAKLETLVELTAREWKRAIRRWERTPSSRVVLFEESQRILTRAASTWAGVPLADREVATRARDLARMVDAFGGVGPRLWKGKLARMRTEAWLRPIVERVQQGKVRVDASSALGVMAARLDAPTAAVEILNVLRPTVAVSWYVAFAALALHEHADVRERLAGGAGVYLDAFVQEVRRFYPFTPYLGAKVRAPFVWRGHRFAKGTLVLLDVHGTNHDPRLYEDPQCFRPERFLVRRIGAFDLIPPGGGDPNVSHRCPGEWITMHELALAVHFLTRCMTYDVARGQDLSFDLRRMPTHPASGFVMQRVRSTPAIDAPAPRVPSRAAARGRDEVANA